MYVTISHVTSAAIRKKFSGASGYLNTSSAGLPSSSTASCLRRALAAWEFGALDPSQFDVAVNRSRAAFAQIAETKVSSVGILSQVSVASAMVAASLPAGSTVLCAEEDFTSLLYPFLVDKRLNIKIVPLERLLDQVDNGVDLIAVSAVQSSDGRVLDLDALHEAAVNHNARTYVDTTQAAGWLKLDTDRFDVTACGAYKWLYSPRGSGFITVNATADWLRPIVSIENDLGDRLSGQRIKAAVRSGRVRLAFYFYNTAEDVSAAAGKPDPQLPTGTKTGVLPLGFDGRLSGYTIAAAVTVVPIVVWTLFIVVEVVMFAATIGFVILVLWALTQAN